MNWALNLLAAIWQIVLAALDGLEPEATRPFAYFSAFCGVVMIVFAIEHDTIALATKKGDPTLAALDMLSQICAGIGNLGPVIPKQSQAEVAIAGNVLASGLWFSTAVYSVANPDALLGSNPPPAT